jgi:hypothetical protein
MTRSKQILALVSSSAALLAFAAPGASAASVDGHSRVARAGNPMAVGASPARMRVASFAPARKGTCPKCGNIVF